MRLSLCEAPIQGVVTVRVRYVPSGSLTPTELIVKSCATEPPVCLSSLSEKTKKSKHLQMSLQRKHFLLSY